MMAFLDPISYYLADKIYYLVCTAMFITMVGLVVMPSSRRLLGRICRHWNGRVGLCFIAAHILISVFGPWLIPHDPYTQFDLGEIARYYPPGLEFPLGTDDRNRDFLARVVSGGRAAIAVTCLTAILAISWGAFAGIFLTLMPRWVDGVVMRIVDALISVPWLAFLLLAMTLFAGARGFSFIPIVGFFYSLAVLRVVRAHATTIVALDYVTAARARGHRIAWIAFHEVLPNCRDVILVELAMRWTWLLLAFAVASFFGLMVEIPAPDWSLMIASSRTLFLSYPYLFWPPVIMLSTLVIGINFTADGLAKAIGLDRRAADMV